MLKDLILVSNKQELQSHVHAGFPLEIIHQELSINSHDFIDWHWHNEIQYSYVLNGKIKFKVGSKQYILSAGNGLLINSQQVHSFSPFENDAEYLCISFHPELFFNVNYDYLFKQYLQPIAKNKSINSMALLKEIPGHKKACDTLMEIHSIYKKKDKFYELALTSAILKLWRETLMCLPPIENKTNQNQVINNRLQRIFIYIQNFYSSPITLEDISKHINLSRSECCRFFQKVTGQNLFTYINRFRINKSVDLLIYTEFSILEIAHNTGFNSQSYFTKYFKEFMKMSPSEYRKKLKE